MSECSECGAFVTTAYYRVFSIGGELHGCQECRHKTEGHRPAEYLDQ